MKNPEGSRKARGLGAAAACLLLCAACLLAPPPAARGEEGEPSSILSRGGLLFLVNREHRVTKKYAPDDLAAPKVAVRKESLRDGILLRGEAALALEKMFGAALREGHVLYAVSGYRSFGIQEILFNEKVKAVGSREKAQRTVAPPGTSEHQLGLAMDLQSPSQTNLNRHFGETAEGAWVAENAHRFGFIVRYRREWEGITGIAYEPWHIRYVGVAHAAAMRRLDIPLETYVRLAGQLPEYVLTEGVDLLLADLAGRLLAGETDAVPEPLLLAEPPGRAEALREATLPLLSEGESYEEALWACYPTPQPTSAPRVDKDEEQHLLPLRGG